MKPNILLLYKRLGETPLATITRYKQAANIQDKLSFAGRLDPMAEGLLLVLRNEENKKRKEYEALRKTYECSLMVGFATDSYDLLGKVTQIANNLPPLREQQELIKKTIPPLIGKHTQQYPPFSSFHINGKPLYYWERRNELDHTTLPKKEITISSAEIIGFETMEKTRLEHELTERLSLVQGDFRQTDIKALWNKKLAETIQNEFLVTNLRITCSSGTYIRGLVNEISTLINLPAVTFSITRTAIGTYTFKDLDGHN